MNYYSSINRTLKIISNINNHNYKYYYILNTKLCHFAKILNKCPYIINYCNKDGINILMICAYYNYIDYIKILLKLGACPNLSNSYSVIPLQIAVAKNNMDSVVTLIEFPNKYGQTSMLLWTNYTDGTSIDIAGMYNHKKIIEYLKSKMLAKNI